MDISTPSASMPVHYTKDGSAIFKLGFKTGLLTFATLGIYRFWQKTRIRKFIWSSTSAGGDAFEYTGTGLEKFLGFLIAIVFLAVYLGVIQMVLFYLGLSMLDQPDPFDPMSTVRFLATFYISFFAVLPFLLYALYRARRYKMARTRWRGIRFGMDKGAWGYAFRAIGYGLLTLVTLGILAPFMSFKLEKYMTDRSHYGDARFQQGGNWTGLYPALKHVLIGIGLLVLAGICGALDIPALAIIAGLVGYIWIFIGFIYYQVRSFAYLTSHKVLAGGITFDAQPRTGEVIKTYIIGGLAIGILAGIAFAILGVVVGGLTAAIGSGASIGSMIGIGLLAIAGYVVVLTLVQALGLSMITQPILAHFIETITIGNPEALNAIRQRESETGVDAEGFADALDIGGAI